MGVMDRMRTGNVGRHGIGQKEPKTQRQNFSNRAFNGNIEVQRKDCPSCHHHKVIRNTVSGMVKCSRCGYRHEK